MPDYSLFVVRLIPRLQFLYHSTDCPDYRFFNKCLWEGHGFQPLRKRTGRFVSGHGFSRAARSRKCTGF